MIKQRKREELYDLFRQGAIPSGADFADFIKSQLNLVDDGLEISEAADAPIGLRGHGKANNYLDLYDSGGDLRWRISGKDEAVTAEGLNLIADSQSKLFVERDTGNVGINTDGPQAKLHIIQTSATDALRVDDAGSDTTPLVVTSEGHVGLGTASPSAKLHLSYSGSGDILRVDDTDSDTTPLIVGETGNVGIGYSEPLAKLAVAGGLAVGSNHNPGSNNLYVAGDLEVAGTVVFSNGSGVGGIEINAPLTSKTKELTLKDNVAICADPAQLGSDGNLTVAGDTTLGSYNKVYESQNVLTINGRIQSGADAGSGEQQYQLEINEILTVDRNPTAPRTKVAGNLAVSGSVTLGDTLTDQVCLNGKVSSNLGDVIIDDGLTVNGSTTLGDTVSDKIYLNGEVSSNQGDVTINDNLKVTGSTALGDALSDNIQLNGTVSSNTGVVQIGNDLNINGALSFDNSSVKIAGVAVAVDNFDDGVITTEGAVKRYVDNQIANANGRIDAVNKKIPGFHFDIRHQLVPGPTGAGSWGSGHTSCYDFYPPDGFKMSQLLHVAVSPEDIPFAGGVDGNDTMACYVTVYSNCIRCYCGNSEQRSYSKVAFYALWKVEG